MIRYYNKFFFLSNEHSISVFERQRMNDVDLNKKKIVAIEAFHQFHSKLEFLV